MEQKSSLKVFPYSERDAVIWDELVASAPMATFIHTRRYLSYHADRFQDVSLLIKDHKDRLVGLFLAAVDPTDSKRVVSHPGITYGGVLHTGDLHGEKMLQAFEVLRNYYSAQGFKKLRYKVIPYIYQQVPATDDLYALFRLGAVRYRCDLSCAIDLANRPEPSQRRQRSLKKALKHGVQVNSGSEFAEHFWVVLEENLAKKYGVRPVHTVEEIILLHSLFPLQIEFIVGVYDSEVVAGIVLFSTAPVIHAQYIASSPKGYQLGALDAVFESCIAEAQTLGNRYFSFGVSTENEGQYLNTSLHQFKTEFGAGGVVHEFYEINLKD